MNSVKDIHQDIELSKKIRHRGPDYHGYFRSDHVFMGHERLAIMGIDSGEQPIIDGDWVLAVNGEI